MHKDENDSGREMKDFCRECTEISITPVMKNGRYASVMMTYSDIVEK